jgi:hypothetical protein
VARVKHRALTQEELFVLSEVQAYWGRQNSVENVFFSELDEAVLVVHDREGSKRVLLVLTNLAAWRDDGTLSLEQLRNYIKGLDGS